MVYEIVIRYTIPFFYHPFLHEEVRVVALGDICGL